MRYRRRENEFRINARKICRGAKASPEAVNECRCVRSFLLLTQKQAAKDLSMSYATLRNWENGFRPMPKKALNEYQRYLRSFFDSDPFINPPEYLSECERIRWEMKRHRITYKSVSAELGVSELTLKRFLYEYPYNIRLTAERVNEAVMKLIEQKAGARK